MLGKIKVQHVSLLSRMRLKLPSVVKNSLSEGQTHLYVHGSKPCQHRQSSFLSPSLKNRGFRFDMRIAGRCL